MKPFEIEKEKYRIVATTDCYILQEARTVKGQIKWRARGYYTKLAECLIGCLRLDIRRSKEELPLALRQAVATVQTAADSLRQALSVTVEVPSEDGEQIKRKVLV